MKKTLIISAIALALASCGGGTTQNNGDTANIKSTKLIAYRDGKPIDVQPTDVQPTDNEPSATDTSSESVAMQVAKILAAQKDTPIKEEDLKLYRGDNDPKNTIIDFSPYGFDGYSVSIIPYPYKTGGYYVLVIWDLRYDKPQYFKYDSYSFKDGKLAKTKSPLPTPGINDFFANADQFPKDAYDEINKRVPFYKYRWYYDNLVVSFECFEYNGGKSFNGYNVPKPLQTYFNALTDDEQYRGMPSINYLWDGEKFVLDPAPLHIPYKPFKEDLTYFGVPAPHGEFAQSGKIINDLYSLDPDNLSITKSDLNKDGKEDLAAAEKHGGLMAVYWGGDNGYTLFKTYQTKNDIILSSYTSTLEIATYQHNYTDNNATNHTRQYTLEYRDNDLYLIQGYASDNPARYGEYDFAEHTWTPINDYGAYEEEKAEPIAAKPLKKLSDFSIGEYHFEDYD